MDVRTAASLLSVAEEASAGLRGPGSKAALERIDGRYDELVGAIEWFIDHEHTDEGLRLANALHRFWITKQRFEDGAFWFDRVLTARGGDTRLRGEAFIRAGFMPFWMGQDDNLDAAESLVREALEISVRTGDEFMRPFALSGLAAIAIERGERERAATLVGAAEAIMEAQHMAWPPDERPHYERMLADLPEAMGSEQFERARGIGRSMTSSESASFALGVIT